MRPSFSLSFCFCEKHSFFVCVFGARFLFCATTVLQITRASFLFKRFVFLLIVASHFFVALIFFNRKHTVFRYFLSIFLLPLRFFIRADDFFSGYAKTRVSAPHFIVFSHASVSFRLFSMHRAQFY